MHVINVIDGVLYQWDTGRKVHVEPEKGTTLSEVHFSYVGNPNAFVRFPDADNTVEIPNRILQFSGMFGVYAVAVTADGRRTESGRSLFIAARAKPDDYVYTDEELESYHALEARVEEIEKNGVTDEQVESAVNKYLDENPIDTGVNFETDATLRLEDGILSVNTADRVEQDNTLPVTSAAVYTEVGNINALLATI